MYEKHYLQGITKYLQSYLTESTFMKSSKYKLRLESTNAISSLQLLHLILTYLITKKKNIKNQYIIVKLNVIVAVSTNSYA